MINEVLASRRLHWPIADRKACLNCHEPHASSEPGLLAEPMRPLCGSCHADVLARGDESPAAHEPVAEGECGLCHQPHASQNVFLFPGGDSIELCGGCHDWQRHSSHPIGDGVIDMRNPNMRVDCSSCHRSHGTPHEHLATFDSKAELCVDCHIDYRR
jgi:predicted CXXCH cytochrome family protein